MSIQGRGTIAQAITDRSWYTYLCFGASNRTELTDRERERETFRIFKTKNVGADYFRKIKWERFVIKYLCGYLYRKMKRECKSVIDKQDAIEKMNGWKLPTNIFELVPDWWKQNGNGIQGGSPSVMAFHELIKEQLEK